MSQSLFTTQVPDIKDAQDGDPGITTATTFKFAVAGTIDAVRFYGCNGANTGVWKVFVWEVTTLDESNAGTGILRATETLSFVPTASWNVVPLSTPVQVDPTKLYRVGVFSERWYVATLSFFADGHITNGDITAYADSTVDIPGYAGTLRQGSYVVTASIPAYPTQTARSASYFADVVFTAGGTPPSAGPTFKIWNGTTELPATASLWTGTAEVPLQLSAIT